jgi:hypothetical protein
MSILDTPIGAGKPYLVKCDGNPFIGFDDKKDAESYIDMMKKCTKGGKKEPAYCALRSWNIEHR